MACGLEATFGHQSKIEGLRHICPWRIVSAHLYMVSSDVLTCSPKAYASRVLFVFITSIQLTLQQAKILHVRPLVFVCAFSLVTLLILSSKMTLTTSSFGLLLNHVWVLYAPVYRHWAHFSKEVTPWKVSLGASGAIWESIRRVKLARATSITARCWTTV